MIRGTALHGLVQLLLKKHSQEVKSVLGLDLVDIEAPVYMDCKLVGRYDYMFVDDKTHQKIILDLKTTEKTKITEPEIEHVEQVMLYARLAGNVQTVGILYYNVSTGKETTFFVPYSPEMGEAQKKKMEALLKAIDTKKTPAPYPEPCKECIEWCQYKYECFSPQALHEKYSKSGDTVEIEKSLEEKYVKLMEGKKAIERELEEVKEIIEFSLSGKRGKGEKLKMTYVSMAEGETLDKDKLAKDVDLDKYKKPTYRGGYYRYTLTQ
jgi:hypothetical protein